MRAEKKSRWRADVATPFAPHTLSEGVFRLRCLAIAFGAKQVRTRELKEPGEFTCSQCGFYIVNCVQHLDTATVNADGAEGLWEHASHSR